MPVGQAGWGLLLNPKDDRVKNTRHSSLEWRLLQYAGETDELL